MKGFLIRRFIYYPYRKLLIFTFTLYTITKPNKRVAIVNFLQLLTTGPDHMPNLYDTAVGLRFMLQLPFFFKSPWTKSTALSIMLNRLGNRQSNFLDIVQNLIYSQKQSPYARLLQQAGIGFGDLEDLVYKQTLEGALEVLFKNGVFLTVDEFKGRCPVIRGSFCMQGSSRSTSQSQLQSACGGPDWWKQRKGHSGPDGFRLPEN